MIDLLDAPEWHADAACKGVSNNLFFPERGDSTRKAKAICAECPVREECLTWAVENNPKAGIWGGMSERQLRVERRRRQSRVTAA